MAHYRCQPSIIQVLAQYARHTKKRGLLSRTQQTPQNQSPYLSYDGISISDGDQRCEQCHGAQCHLMVFWRTACTSVSSNAYRYTIVSRGEHSGKHTAIGGDTTYRDLFSAFNGFAQHASPLAESVATDHGMALRQFRGIRGEIVHRIVGSNQKLRPIFEIINPSVLR